MFVLAGRLDVRGFGACALVSLVGLTGLATHLTPLWRAGATGRACGGKT